MLMILGLTMLLAGAPASLLPPPPMLQGGAPIIGPNDALGFDYVDANIVNYAVTHFEVQYDTAPFVMLQPTQVILGDTPPGSTTYRFVPPFSSGTHTAMVRACRAEGCGGGSNPFAFGYAVANPAVPLNLRKVPRT